MAEYYRSEVRSVHAVRSERRSTIGVLLDGVAILLTPFACVGLLLSLLGPCFTPAGRLLPLLGLLAPATYLLTLCLTLYWVARWRWRWAFIPLILLAVATLFLDRFLKLPIRNINQQQRSEVRGSLKFITYNVRQFYALDGGSNRDSLIAWVGRERPDILCLQEFCPNTGKGSKRLVDSLLDAAAGCSYYSTTGDTITEQAIYSRYRILRSGRTRKQIPELRSIWADLLVGEDTLRVYNNHLHSNLISSEDQQFFSAESFLLDTAREERVRSIIGRFSDNSLRRAAQADTIARIAAQTQLRTILCGDFNDTPMSYVYRTMRGDRIDAFSEAGRGFSYTFRGLYNMLRIDYVLLDPSLEVIDYQSPEVDYSDHLPVVVRFKR